MKTIPLRGLVGVLACAVGVSVPEVAAAQSPNSCASDTTVASRIELSNLRRITEDSSALSVRAKAAFRAPPDLQASEIVVVTDPEDCARAAQIFYVLRDGSGAVVQGPILLVRLRDVYVVIEPQLPPASQSTPIAYVRYVLSGDFKRLLATVVYY